MMVTMLMPVLAVGVIMPASENGGAACAARRRGAEGACESCAFRSEHVQAGGADDGIAVTTRIVRTLVVHHIKQHIGPRCGLVCCVHVSGHRRCRRAHTRHESAP